MPRCTHLPRRTIQTVLGVGVCVFLLSCEWCESPITRAIHYLHANQVQDDWSMLRDGRYVADYAGDWPQFFYLEAAPGLRIRDVSPFVVSFIHHSLTNIVDDNAAGLDLDSETVELAADMRRRAIVLLRRFEGTPGQPDAGAFGFWPYDQHPDRADSPRASFVFELLQGPVLGGSRLPLNLHAYPKELAIPSDADVTATTYASILDDALLDGGAGTGAEDIATLFTDWRDTGAVPLRLNPEWLPHASGVFLTWLAYSNGGDAPVPNDVDLVVNANVLYALGRYGRLDASGADEAIALINQAIEQGLHRTAPDEISNYYPDNFALHYCVSRAYHEGPVPELQPAVDILADDVEQSAIVREDGTAYWERGGTHLATAFAVLTLVNAGRSGELVDGAVQYLLDEQDPVCGNWDECVFFIGKADTGLQVNWGSASFTTAIVTEALCRYKLSLASSSN